MANDLIDRWHLGFVLWDLLGAEGLFRLEAFGGHDRATAEAMLETAAELAREGFLPSYQALDAAEPRVENGRVVLPDAISQALEAFAAQGFPAMAAAPGDGGLGLPRTIANAAFLSFQAANISIANYAMLTASAAELIAHHGSAEQKVRYMAPMLDGRFFGTMALSEPQAGSSLGDIKTSARPLGDGRYALSGNKMWISGAEHDMAENIVHLMLARIEGAAPGVRGLSLFIVPRRRLDAAGRPGLWNNVGLAGLNHKMGQRGTVNTVLNIGEGGETIGEIVGKPGQGLASMFTMMNEARIGVAMGAVAHASAGFRISLAYARERLQGRPPGDKDPASPQVALVRHADIRRMLLQQKAAAEGGIALALYLARLADLKKAAASEGERRDAALLLDFLTPVFKAWVSEECLTANSNAMQVLGGAGYTRDFPLEQHYRDNRLNPIHEGTNGIQALDLAGRKATMADGRALALFCERVAETVAAAGAEPRLEGVRQELGAALGHLREANGRLAGIAAARGAEAQLALAGDFMELVGATAFAWIWLEQARVAAGLLAGAGDAQCSKLEGLIATCHFVFAHAMPRGSAAAGRIAADLAPHRDIDEALLG